MKSLNKILKLIYCFLFVGAALLIIKWEMIIEVLTSLSQSEDDILFTIYKRFFLEADTWNMIFFFFFAGVFMWLFIAMDSLLYWVNFKLALKKPKLKWLLNVWYNITIQKALGFIFVFILFIIGANITVNQYGKGHSVSSPSEVKKPIAVVILGTSKFLQTGKGAGKPNLYYKYRMDAALDLFKNDKVKEFIISGDKSKGHVDAATGKIYDEIKDIKDDLLAAGVPEEKIKTDTAGYRTLDSILRIRGMFGLNDMLIVSQDFQVSRALFQAWFYRIRATGYNTKGTATFAMVKREFFISKPSVIVDLFLFNLKPKIQITDANGKAVVYREDFKIKSGIHIIAIIGVFFFFMVMFMAIWKAFDTDYASRLNQPTI